MGIHWTKKFERGPKLSEIPITTVSCIWDSTIPSETVEKFSSRPDFSGISRIPTTLSRITSALSFSSRAIRATRLTSISIGTAVARGSRFSAVEPQEFSLFGSNPEYRAFSSLLPRYAGI